MENIFKDLNASLNHVLAHVGQTGIRRKETYYAFSDFGGLYSLCLSLMTEKGAKPESREALEKYYLRVKDTKAVRNYLYLSGAPVSYGPVKPGCLIGFTVSKGVADYGLVLETDKAGQPLKTIMLTGSSPEATLTVQEKLVPAGTIFESFEISEEKRQWPDNKEMAAFYGNWNALVLAISLRETANRTYTFTYSGNHIELYQFNPVHLLILLGLESPAWMLERMLYCQDRQIADAVQVFNTFGKGLQPYKKGLKLVPGTILFTTDGKTAVVIATDTNGLPSVMMQATNDNYLLNPYMIFNPVEHEYIDAYWEPATVSYDYKTRTEPDTFTDKNIWLGKLSLLGSFFMKNSNYEQPLFKTPFLLDKNCMSAALISLLRKGPADAAAWQEYLKPYGQGWQQPDKGIEPGDFILYKDNYNSLQQAIALPGGNMLHTSYGDFTVIPVASLVGFWKPSVQKKK